jgi:acetyl esterase/lipase
VHRIKPSLLLAALPLIFLAGIAGHVRADDLWQRSFGEVQSLDFRVADQRVPYGSDAGQFIDLWLPRRDKSEPAPVVVLIHGGCWLAEYDISHVRPLATAIADHGFAVWAIEYRRVGQAGGGWPGTFRDVAAAVDALRTFRHPRLENHKVVFAGHSAGGHLALWAAGRSRLSSGQELYQENPLAPMGVVGLAAITDLAEYARGDSSCQQAAPRLMGGGPEQFPERYAQASPAVLGTDIPVVLVQGNADGIVPPGQARSLASAKVVELENAGHFDLIHTGTPAFSGLIEIFTELLAR